MASASDKHECGLRAPATYDEEPPRDPSLIINSKVSFLISPID